MLAEFAMQPSGSRPMLLTLAMQPPGPWPMLLSRQMVVVKRAMAVMMVTLMVMMDDGVHEEALARNE